MPKNIKARKNHKCHECKSDIPKGDHYTRKSIRMGESGMVGYDDTVHTWEPYYVNVAVCVICAYTDQ